jgi:hypothetical protein
MHIVTHTYIRTPSLCALMCQYVICMCWEYLHIVLQPGDIVLCKKHAHTCI